MFLTALSLIKNNWRIISVSVVCVLCFFLGYWQANTVAEAKLAKELQTQIEVTKIAEAEAAKLRTDIETRKQEFENEIKTNKVYINCTVPNAAKLHINSIK